MIFLRCWRFRGSILAPVEARGPILEARGPILRFSCFFWILGPKSSLEDPPKTHTNTLLGGCGFAAFFECFLFWTFVILSAQILNFGFHFTSFLGALGLFKNSWKCVTVINYRGLTPSGESLLAGLDRECVLMLSLWRIVWFCVVLGNPFWALLVPIVAKNKSAKNRAASTAAGFENGGGVPLKEYTTRH